MWEWSIVNSKSTFKLYHCIHNILLFDRYNVILFMNRMVLYMNILATFQACTGHAIWLKCLGAFAVRRLWQLLRFSRNIRRRFDDHCAVKLYYLSSSVRRQKRRQTGRRFGIIKMVTCFNYIAKILEKVFSKKYRFERLCKKNLKRVTMFELCLYLYN